MYVLQTGKHNLTRLPSTMEHLSVSNNRFTGPLDLQHLSPSLKSLQCAFNDFSGRVMFDSLPVGLHHLTLGHNSNLRGDGSKIPVLPMGVDVSSTKISMKH